MVLLSFREWRVGGAVGSGSLQRLEGGSLLDWNAHAASLRTASRGRRVVVLLHGYNVCQDEALRVLPAYAARLALGPGDILLPVLWPGDGFAKFLTYPFEGRDADDTADALSKWLHDVLAPDARVAFVAHSLGCRVAMQAARNLLRERPQVLDRICLMAPALDNDCLGRSGRTCYAEATRAADRIAVLASEEDEVLRYAYPLGDLAQLVLEGGRWGRALGRTGPVERDRAILERLELVPLADPGRSVDHGDYLDPAAPADTAPFVADFLARRPGLRWSAQR